MKHVSLLMMAMLGAGCSGRPPATTALSEETSTTTMTPAAPKNRSPVLPVVASATWPTMPPATKPAPEPEKPAEVGAEELWHSRETLGHAWNSKYPLGKRIRITGIIGRPFVRESPSGKREFRLSFYTFIANPHDERLPATLEHLSKLPPRFKSTSHVHCVFDQPDELVDLDGLDPATIEGNLAGYEEHPFAGLVFTDCKVVRRPLK
jgi:hypothetical protein